MLVLPAMPTRMIATVQFLFAEFCFHLVKMRMLYFMIENWVLLVGNIGVLFLFKSLTVRECVWKRS